MRSFNSFVEEKHVGVLVERTARIMEEQGIDPNKYMLSYIQEHHPEAIDENWFSRLGSSLGNTWQTMKSGWMANPKQDLATIKKHLDHWTNNLAQYDTTGQLSQAATGAMNALKDLPIDQISKDVQTRYVAKNPQAANQQQTNPQTGNQPQTPDQQYGDVKPGPGPRGAETGTAANPITADALPNPEDGTTQTTVQTPQSNQGSGVIDAAPQTGQGNQGGVLDAAPQTPQGTQGVGSQQVGAQNPPQGVTQATAQAQQPKMPQSPEEWEQLKQQNPQWYDYLRNNQPQVAHNEIEGEVIQEWVDTAKRIGIG